jgi:fatty-acyl-CoA synthase
MTEFTFATNLEALAAAFPERPFLSSRQRSLNYGQFRDRSRQLANYLRARGLGQVTPRSELADHESGQDHVGLYLYNGSEYLEGMMGAYMSRTASINVNYRYVTSELAYLLNDARPKALIYHARFAPVLGALSEQLERVAVLLQVADESAEPLLPGAVDYEQALASTPAVRPDCQPSPDDLYIVYTGGTTGMPKGVMWRQHDAFMGAMGGTYGDGKQHLSLSSVVEGAERLGHKLRVCPIPPFMHGAAHWMAFVTMSNGGSIHLPGAPERLNPRDVWELAERVRATNVLIVGDAFAIPLLEELDHRRYDLSALRMLSSGGAILSAHVKARLKEHIPGLFIRDTLGSSESGAQAVVLEDRSEFRLLPDSGVADAGLTRLLAPGEDEVGYLVRKGHIPLGYLNDPTKTQRTFVRIAGHRYAVPGDHAQLTAEGNVRLLGRGSICINSGGEKIHPEEVEQALKTHPHVYDAVVVGVPHPKWGTMVAAVVQARGDNAPTLAELQTHLAQMLAGYKHPKRLALVAEMQRSPAGKADYRWAKGVAMQAGDGELS